MSYRKHGLLLGLVLVAFAIFGTAIAAAGDDPQPVDFTHNATGAPAPVAGAVFGTGPAVKTGHGDLHDGDAERRERQHRLRGRRPAQRDLDRGQSDRTPPNMIGGANDYQLGVNPGGHVSETRPVASARHLRRRPDLVGVPDLYSNSAYQATGDPAVAFDASGPRLLRDARLPLRRPGQRARTRTSWWPTPATAAGPGRSRASPRQRHRDQRRRPARQGVRRRVGQRQRDRHLRRLPARPEGRVRQRAHLRSVTHDGGADLVDAAGDLREPRRGVRLRADGGRRRPGLRRRS